MFFLKKDQLVDVKIGNASFKAEIADNFLERAKGLMFRKDLPKENGMIFVFPSENYYGFWMMNTSIPLDIIWIGSNKTIVHIEKNAQPCLFNCTTYKPDEKAMYVLEINGNLTKKYGIKIGDKVSFRL
ncbi:MAG TPA: DUF192 domain-containing protein [archaeon]|nr:DUF192 domain-containing protein [archaeon]